MESQTESEMSFVNVRDDDEQISEENSSMLSRTLENIPEGHIDLSTDNIVVVDV